MLIILDLLKKFSFFLFFLILILKSLSVYGEIEKGKWNFVKDSDYCYIGSAPISTEIPEGKKRGDPYILVYRMNKNPEAIVQIHAGYNYKKDETVKVMIDKIVYDFWEEEDSAWTDNDTKVIYAMQKGVKLVVTGFSSRGTKTVDTYTLNGFTASFNKLVKDC
tara:strand:- start:1654 stop:2142 length:489 start_codon:yes stop_codon:yes gene_type:complete